jgi:hypothetical protein
VRSRRRPAVLAALSIAVTALTTTAVLAVSALAADAAPQRFEPGLIISDGSFYNHFAMTAPQIQAFLDARDCTPKDDSPCLADYRQTTTTMPAEPGHCAEYAGAKRERASTIIAKVASACGINPQVLIVLMQKEQSLVTHPSAVGYERATGYACPDTAECDARFFGLFNQLYQAAWQFREYGYSSGWRYHVGSVRIQYNPDTACGSSIVRIQNQATANLYNYTPYQPNAATLAHPTGSGDKCAAYGNLNFSRIFTKWFGSPLAEPLPPWWSPCLNFEGGRSCPPIIPRAIA